MVSGGIDAPVHIQHTACIYTITHATIYIYIHTYIYIYIYILYTHTYRLYIEINI